MVGHSPFWVRYRKKMVPFRIGRQCVCWSWWLRRWWFAKFVLIFCIYMYKYISLYISTSINLLVYQALLEDDHEWVSTKEPNHQPPKDASQAMLRHPKSKIPCLQTPGIDIFFVKRNTYFPKAKNSKKKPVFQCLVEFFFFCWGGVVDEYPAMRQMLQVFIANRETRSHPSELLCAQGYFGIARRWRQGEREATGLKGKQQEILDDLELFDFIHLGHWTRLKKTGPFWIFLRNTGNTWQRFLLPGNCGQVKKVAGALGASSDKDRAPLCSSIFLRQRLIFFQTSFLQKYWPPKANLAPNIGIWKIRFLLLEELCL